MVGVDLVFPVDFHILDIPPNNPGKPSSILLGRPFLKTSRFKLDVFEGIYSFKVNGKVVEFELNEVVEDQPNEHSIFWCDVLKDDEKEVQLGTQEGLRVDKKLNEKSSNLVTLTSSPPKEKKSSQVSSEESKYVPPHLRQASQEERRFLM
ncbi:hypothetical protein PIB30_073886, partial [Stylosanthes scabra]|nr:hypothetical protein [Stylosanthes scabra]